MVSAYVKPSITKSPAKRKSENALHHGYFGFPPNFKRRKVGAIREYPSECCVVAFHTDQRNNEVDIVAAGTSCSPANKPSDYVVQTAQIDVLCSLGHIPQPGPSIITALRPIIDQKKGEGDFISLGTAVGSCIPAKPLETATQVKDIDVLTSLGSMSQSQPSCLLSPQNGSMEKEEIPVAAARSLDTLARPLKTAAQAKQINAVTDAVKMGTPVPVLENVEQAKHIDILGSLPYISSSQPPSTVTTVVKNTIAKGFPPPRILKKFPVNRDFPVGFGDPNFVLSPKHRCLAKSKSPANIHMKVEVPTDDALNQKGHKAQDIVCQEVNEHMKVEVPTDDALNQKGHKAQDIVCQEVNEHMKDEVLTDGALNQIGHEAEDIVGQEVNEHMKFEVLTNGSLNHIGHEAQEIVGQEVNEHMKVEVLTDGALNQIGHESQEIVGQEVNEHMKVEVPADGLLNQIGHEAQDIAGQEVNEHMKVVVLTDGALNQIGHESQEIVGQEVNEYMKVEVPADGLLNQIGHEAQDIVGQEVNEHMKVEVPADGALNQMGDKAQEIVGQEIYYPIIAPTLEITQTDDNHRNKVGDALNLFRELFTKLAKEQETGPKRSRGHMSTYVAAAMSMKNQQQWVNTSKQFGAVSGINVGDNFYCRAELVVIGLHNNFQCGIDYMKKDGEILATSIVDSGRYANGMESADLLIYSGQGGNPTVRKGQLEDQKLERGNLALKNSMVAKIPIRVVRGSKAWIATHYRGSTSKKTTPKFVYDGLYVVDSYWQERGQFGKLVYKFKLKRIPVQPKLTMLVGKSEFPSGVMNKSKKSKVCKGHSVSRIMKKSKKTKVRKGILSRILSKSKKSKVCKGIRVVDISQDKEKVPIRVVNKVDDDKLPSFNYITNMIYPERNDGSMPSCCDCLDGCSNVKDCPCALKNGGDFPYNINGALIEIKPLVYECGPSCKCYSACINRVSQHGIRFSLEIFKTKSKGWGVRSRDYIPSGSFICEYVGELLLSKDAEVRINKDEYLFDIGSTPGDGPRSLIDNDDGFTIDAAQYGNVARFINHSCSPNLYAQNVLYDHNDSRAPHIMLFATKNIRPLREITYDYNYVIGNVCDSSGNAKIKNCYCGSSDCKGRLY